MKILTLLILTAVSAFGQAMGTPQAVFTNSSPTVFELRWQLEGKTYSLSITNPVFTAVSPKVKPPATLPPLPPAAPPSKKTVLELGQPLAAYTNKTVPGYPRFTVLTNEIAKLKAKIKSVIFPGPPLMATNIWFYDEPDHHVPIFSADAVGMSYGKTYLLERRANLEAPWNNYYGPFVWQYQDPFAYLRWQDVIERAPCVPPAPNGATNCPAAKQFWRVRQVP